MLSAINHRRKSDRIGCARGTQGKSCLLVMNGPSLNQSRAVLEARETDCVFAVNYFAESEFFETARPEYYVLQDSHFWRDDVLESYKVQREATFAALDEKTRWPMIVFLPSSCRRRDWIRQQFKNPHICIRFWNAGFIRRRRSEGGYLGESSVLFRLWQREWAAPPPDNVLVASLYLAERLGFVDLNIIGADFSFFMEMLVDQQTNRVGRKVEHFYGEENCTIYKGNTGQVPTNMAHEMWRWYRAFRLLEVMHAYLKFRGVRTVNNSAYSFIDCFPRA